MKRQVTMLVLLYLVLMANGNTLCGGSDTQLPPVVNYAASHTDPSTPSDVEMKVEKKYEILSDSVAYSRWRSIIHRLVRMPNGNVVDFDVVDQKGSGAVIIFAWCSKTKTATLVKEYNPGCARLLAGVAAGIVETSETKHGGDPLKAAKFELEEECHLEGGTWHRLTNEGVSVPMDKYSKTEITPFLVVDATHVENPRPLDAEEDIEILRGVTIETIFQWIRSGDMNLTAAWACLLAIEKLRELGEI